MQPSGQTNLRYYLKWVLWALLVQFALANISAAIYAYKFTHFFKEPADWNVAHPKSVFDKTWKLFKGPSFGKDETNHCHGSLFNSYPFPFLTVIILIAGTVLCLIQLERFASFMDSHQAKPFT
jgi:hypothetical protein